MKEKNYISQYLTVFCISWIMLYLIFPAWISKHLMFNSLQYPVGRAIVVSSLFIYFVLSTYIMNFSLKSLVIDKPFIVSIQGWFNNIKEHVWLVAMFCLAAVLHIHTFSYVTILGEKPFLFQSFWMYDIINSYWHSLFAFPIQIIFWTLMLTLLLVSKQKTLIRTMGSYVDKWVNIFKTNLLIKLIVIVSIFVFFNVYAQFFPYYSVGESLPLTRYPPVFKFLYLGTYFGFGMSHIVPRIMQLLFYILSAIYLYRTMYLFNDKETALLGATIFLFSPIIFTYSSQAALTSGTVFFLIITSFYFLRFIKDNDDRDLLLCAYFIGIGFLYKRPLVLMFFVCFSFLALKMMVRPNKHSFKHLMVLFLSLIPILPWFKIGPKIFDVYLTNLISPDHIFTWLLMMRDQLPVIIQALLVLSIVQIVITKRKSLLLYFGLLFIAYYVFFTVLPDTAALNYRYSLVFYPTIAVFLAQFISESSRKIRWRYAYKLLFAVLTIYLIIISLLPRTSSNTVTFKYKDFETQYFPVDKATDWIKNNTENNAKIFPFFIPTYKFYIDSIYADRNEMGQRKFIFNIPGRLPREMIYPLDSFRKICEENNISYIVFGYTPNNAYPTFAKRFMKRQENRIYLKENMDSEFIKVAEFSNEDNYIFIYKAL